MASDSPVPSQLFGALTDRMTLNRDGFGLPYYEDTVSLMPLMEDTFSDFRRLQEIFPDANSVWNEDGPDFRFGVPVRLEVFWDLDTDERGIAIFDDHNQLIVHVLTALFGYDGSGPEFSRQILEHFGVPGVVFTELQRLLKNDHHYKAVIARERADSSWIWWRVR